MVIVHKSKVEIKKRHPGGESRLALFFVDEASLTLMTHLVRIEAMLSHPISVQGTPVNFSRRCQALLPSGLQRYIPMDSWLKTGINFGLARNMSSVYLPKRLAIRIESSYYWNICVYLQCDYQ